MKKATYPGINIQYPISQLILSGLKTIETRTYPIPEIYTGVDLLLIETPGASGNFSARIVGKIRFDRSFKYRSSEHFYADKNKHYVDENSPWKWDDLKGKWGWPILYINTFDESIIAPEKKGIKFTRDIEL